MTREDGIHQVSSNPFEGCDPNQITLMKEMCIVIDEKDQVIGNASKKACHLMDSIEKNMLHRAFSVFLFDASGKKLLLQQRAKEKITFPERWTNTCCSHPLYIENELEEYEQLGVKRAAIRKLKHELGIEDISLPDVRFITRIHYKAQSDMNWGEHEIDYILFIRKDVRLNVNYNEVKELKELLLSSGGQITPWFRLIVDEYLFDWWKAFENGLLPAMDNTRIYKLN
jgi:isopentenyl-diphosphate delta-isomerase